MRGLGSVPHLQLSDESLQQPLAVPTLQPGSEALRSAGGGGWRLGGEEKEPTVGQAG